MELLKEMRWIFSGAGVVGLVSLLAWLRRAGGKKLRNLSSVVDQVRCSSLAIGQAEAFNAIVGMTVRFKGRVVRATASDNCSVTVDFEVRRDIHVRCAFERQHFPEIALLQEGQKQHIRGKIIRASRDFIEVCPLPSAS